MGGMGNTSNGLQARIKTATLLAVAGCAAVCRAGQLTSEQPAPGRDTGRIYYYVPDGLDLSRPVPLLVFLHGGDARTPDTAPEKYLHENGGFMMPALKHAPFVVAAPSAPPAPDGSRWNREGVSRFIDATIDAACKRFPIDRDRVFLGGHSMGCYGAYHLGQILADRFAGVWASAGAWWESDFRAFEGTPVYIQHGKLDCSTRPGYSGGHDKPRRHNWCGVSFARAAHELMARQDIEHVYDEHDEGHSLKFPAAQAAMCRFFAWTADKKRNPYARRAVLVTPCGTKHPDVERVVRARWLELSETEPGEIAVAAIVLHGPNIASSEEDLDRQTYSLVLRRWSSGARIIAENMGDNRFKVQTENVKRFNLYLSPEMGDLEKPFTVQLVTALPPYARLSGDGKSVTVKAEPVSGDRDYTARLVLAVE